MIETARIMLRTNLFVKPKPYFPACHTQEEIAGAVEIPQQTIADWMKDFTEKLAADNSVKWTDFDPPIYNVCIRKIFPHTRAGAHKQDGTVPFTRTEAARAIRRCGELLKQIPASKGGDPSLFHAHDGADMSVTRTTTAREAGLSERQKAKIQDLPANHEPQIIGCYVLLSGTILPLQ